jgi:two-component system, OmpR family, sensor histidine kinase BaeS
MNHHGRDHQRIHVHLRRERPAWWPENEAWPPRPKHWPETRGKVYRRMGCFILLAVLGLLFIFSLMLGLTASVLGLLHLPTTFSWFMPAGIGMLLLGLAALLLAGRGLRRMSAPLGDLFDAAGRIAEGDYTQRVQERGTPEIRSLVRAFNGMADRLQTTEEQRRDLMADITHELRTPLTVIRGNLEGILDGVYAPDEARLKSVLEETQVLSRLVEDLRTLALAESGALQLRREPTDLSGLIAQTVSAFRAQADAAGIRIEVQSPADAPAVNVDPERMRQVLINLIANALRYTPRDGVISLQYALTEREGERLAEVTVRDDGVGIAPDVLPHIFDRFYKSRDSSGTGLGLPIARHLVEAHRGRISAESRPGQGTAIRIELPLDEG